MNKIKPKEKYLYKITNLINGKIYIGQTINPDKRWMQHKNKAKYLHDNYAIHLAMHKYGINNFSFEILEKTEDYDRRECELIKYYNSKTPNGYNISDGGPNFIAFGEDNPKTTISDDTVLLVINALKENKLSDREIAKKYGTTDNIVSDINHGITHIIPEIKYPIRVKRGKQKLTQIEVCEIKNLLENTLTSYAEIAELYSVSKGAIYHINKGLTFKEDRKYPIRSVHRVN